MDKRNITHDNWFRERLLKRFTDYIKIDTTSDRHFQSEPTTPGQLELAEKLYGELKDLGLTDIEISAGGFLFAVLPANLPSGSKEPPVIGFMAHLDTSDEAPGKDIKPELHENYNGGVIKLKDGVVLDPDEFPALLDYRGNTVITSDGTTLLGADDKAGIAEIMTAIEYLQSHREIKHGNIQIIFTPDEEQALSMERFPVEKVKAEYCYTIDGGKEGTIEAECFEAYKAELIFQGISIHPGAARGKLVNAIEMVNSFLSLLPQAESAQATDNRYGFYFPLEIKGKPEEAELLLYLRDFEEEVVKRRIEAVKTFAQSVEAAYPGGKVTVNVKKQYCNMLQHLRKAPEVTALLEEAIRESGIEPQTEIVRGGTDGARLSELGIPTPNVFAGGFNFHSRKEWVPLPAMVRATQTVINLSRLWAERS
ncbi:Peptidase T [subsurface metagenome]